ncbi:hypothetical protein [Pseudoalteromonas obscura]|uniref:Uncharacterized protein n=1 Tax=Pseudoalteromonas obscura TaxID=3048491 RepID=A0ABT7EP60_9GAMM|nr:hypothetical protein [Pseudoalteromonas sp. P94(2023)]MDK2596842.1 hypothetical protein [Pseudoalteromonas sp. P94(2023)]
MEESNAFFIIYSVFHGAAGVIGVASIVIAFVAAYKFSKVKQLPWGNVLPYSLLVSVGLSVAERVIIDFFLEPSTERVVLAESIFLFILTIPYLVGCIAIYKIAGHISQIE